MLHAGGPLFPQSWSPPGRASWQTAAADRCRCTPRLQALLYVMRDLPAGASVVRRVGVWLGGASSCRRNVVCIMVAPATMAAAGGGRPPRADVPRTTTQTRFIEPPPRLLCGPGGTRGTTLTTHHPLLPLLPASCSRRVPPLLSVSHDDVPCGPSDDVAVSLADCESCCSCRCCDSHRLCGRCSGGDGWSGGGGGAADGHRRRLLLRGADGGADGSADGGADGDDHAVACGNVGGHAGAVTGASAHSGGARHFWCGLRRPRPRLPIWAQVHL